MKNKYFLFIILSFFAITSCSGDNDDTTPEQGSNGLKCSVETVTISAEGSSTDVTITAEREWGLYTSDSWIKTSVVSGLKGETVVRVFAEANPTTQQREGTIQFTSGSARQTIKVVQDAGVKDVYPTPDGYRLVWHDEFDAGSELNSTYWTHEVQGSGWVNNELQNYVNHKSPDGRNVTELRNGNLYINCFKENGKIYSGRVYAKVNEGWQYGYFEAKIKLPKGKGTWPAFWMMPVGNDWDTNPWPMCGEIDIMEEVGCVPNEVSSSIHTQDYNHNMNTQKTHAMTIADAEGEFHVYAIEWTEDKITTYVDGQVQLDVTKSALGSGHNQWPFHYAFYPILNLAWGGSWGGMYGVDESALPVTMEVDYIRVFQKQ